MIFYLKLARYTIAWVFPCSFHDKARGPRPWRLKEGRNRKRHPSPTGNRACTFLNGTRYSTRRQPSDRHWCDTNDTVHTHKVSGRTKVTHLFTGTLTSSSRLVVDRILVTTLFRFHEKCLLDNGRSTSNCINQPSSAPSVFGFHLP